MDEIKNRPQESVIDYTLTLPSGVEIKKEYLGWDNYLKNKPVRHDEYKAWAIFWFVITIILSIILIS